MPPPRLELDSHSTCAFATYAIVSLFEVFASCQHITSLLPPSQKRQLLWPPSLTKIIWCRKTWPLSTLVSAPSSCRTGDSNSCPLNLKLGALTKWLASRTLVCVSRQASLHSSLLQYPVGTALGHSGNGQVSLSVTCQGISTTWFKHQLLYVPS